MAAAMPLRVGLIGDRDDSVPAHRAIPMALQQAGTAVGVTIDLHWVPTDSIDDDGHAVSGHDALWCVPASPYRSMHGALAGIRHARETGLPFLGTCGGFQHAVIEFARHVLGWTDADHAETAPNALRSVIAPLSCALIDVSDDLRLVPGSRLAGAYGREVVEEGYRCRYGMNRRFAHALTCGDLRAAAHDRDGEVRAVELTGHPFFVATLFQPERAALRGEPVPPAEALLRASIVARAKEGMTCC